MLAMAAAGIVAALCAVVVRQRTPEIAVALTAAACLLLLWNTLPLLETIRDVLGRYDGESQRQALTALVQRLADQAQKARATAQRLFRVYVALGVAGGLFCVIML